MILHLRSNAVGTEHQNTSVSQSSNAKFGHWCTDTLFLSHISMHNAILSHGIGVARIRNWGWPKWTS